MMITHDHFLWNLLLVWNHMFAFCSLVTETFLLTFILIGFAAVSVPSLSNVSSDPFLSHSVSQMYCFFASLMLYCFILKFCCSIFGRATCTFFNIYLQFSPVWTLWWTDTELSRTTGGQVTRLEFTYCTYSTVWRTCNYVRYCCRLKYQKIDLTMFPYCFVC